MRVCEGVHVSLVVNNGGRCALVTWTVILWELLFTVVSYEEQESMERKSVAKKSQECEKKSQEC